MENAPHHAPHKRLGRRFRFARPIAFALIALATIIGVISFAFGPDSSTVLSYWLTKTHVLPILILLACVDVALEGVGWLWVYNRVGIRCWDRGGAIAFLTGRAGLILPAQLGRLLRPDAMARLERASIGDCLKAEAAAFVLDATSVVTLIVGLVAFKFHWALAPVAMIGCAGTLLFLGNRIATKLSKTKLALPHHFWWSWKTGAIIVVEMTGWVAHGLGLWLMIKDLPAAVTATDTVLFTSAAAVVGAGTGLPGGIGATEGVLGFSLSIMKVAPEHLAVAIGSFRLLTFWIWIPIGWLALLILNRRLAQRALNAVRERATIVEPKPDPDPEAAASIATATAAT